MLIVTDEYRAGHRRRGPNIELLAKELARNSHTVAIATAWQPDAPTQEVEGPVQIHRVRDLPSRMRWISEEPASATCPPLPRSGGGGARLRRLIAGFEPGI